MTWSQPPNPTLPSESTPNPGDSYPSPAELARREREWIEMFAGQVEQESIRESERSPYTYGTPVDPCPG